MNHAIRNPRDGKYDETVCYDAPTQIKSICESLRCGQKAWSAAPLSHRVEVLMQFEKALVEVRDRLVDDLWRDTGRYQESLLEVDGVTASIEKWCQNAAQVLAEPSTKKASLNYIDIDCQYVPYPVVGVISPWNFPFLLSLIDAIPALLAGCSVIIKPSEITPRFVASLKLALEKVPALTEVMSIVIGDAATGAEIISNVDSLCFTGSVATGKKIAESAARRLIPVFLELGGKDAALVFDDVDLDRTAASLIWGGMANAGQVCLSIERVYVHTAVYRALAKKLVDHAKRLTFCSEGNLQHGQIGPIIAEAQVDVIQKQFDDAREKGAEFLCGGQIVNIDGGFWCQPTIIAGAGHDMKIASEETFAPVLCLIEVADEDQAVSMANDSRYGLSAAVFTNDVNRAYRVARQLEAGGVSINDCSLTGMVHDGEKHAFKSSGLGGSRMGPSSIMRFVRKKALLRNTDQTWNSWWF